MLLLLLLLLWLWLLLLLLVLTLLGNRTVRKGLSLLLLTLLA